VPVAVDLTGTTAVVMNNFTSGLVRAASGLLAAMGISPLISGLRCVVATGVTTAVNVAADIASTAMNAIATAVRSLRRQKFDAEESLHAHSVDNTASVCDGR